MSEPRPEAEEPQTTKSNPWDDILKDFQSLGQNISKAVQEAVHDEKYKESLKDLRQGLENTVNQVAKSIDEAVKSPQAEEVKVEVKKAVGEVKEAGSKAYSDTKPFLITALQTLNDGIQKLIDRLQEPHPEATAEAEGETPSTEEGA